MRGGSYDFVILGQQQKDVESVLECANWNSLLLPFFLDPYSFCSCIENVKIMGAYRINSITMLRENFLVKMWLMSLATSQAES